MAKEKNKAALADAAEWFARLGDEPVDEAVRKDWRQWLAAAPEHAAAWARVERIAAPFSRLRASAPPACSRQALQDAQRQPRRQAVRLLGFGALALGSLGLLGAALPRSTQWQVLAALNTDLQTGVGESRQQELDDGSQLSLNTATRVRVDYSDSLRRIVLYEGEILIDSGIDRRPVPRPLVVDTEQGRITALGTRFSVRRGDGETRINVFAGAVRLAPVDGDATLIVPAGESGRLTTGLANASGSALAAREGWSKGLLIADDMRLADFLGELGRYTRVKLEAEPQLGAIRLVGVYRIGNPSRDVPLILAALEASLPLTVVTTEPGRVHLVGK
jgi:transmembrane sensor